LANYFRSPILFSYLDEYITEDNSNFDYRHMVGDGYNKYTVLPKFESLKQSINIYEERSLTLKFQQNIFHSIAVDQNNNWFDEPEEYIYGAIVTGR